MAIMCTCVSQIASRSMVLVIDLLALGDSAALDMLLIRLLSASTPIKAGCAIGEDIAALARSHPALQAFQACGGLLDLRTVFVQHISATGLPVRLRIAALHGHLLQCLHAFLSGYFQQPAGVPSEGQKAHQS